ncbi:hypothetical protein SDJN02_12998, partial [Cucurbita argyrosperma subsp. argyrosperma]
MQNAIRREVFGLSCLYIVRHTVDDSCLSRRMSLIGRQFSFKSTWNCAASLPRPYTQNCSIFSELSHLLDDLHRISFADDSDRVFWWDIDFITCCLHYQRGSSTDSTVFCNNEYVSGRPT